MILEWGAISFSRSSSLPRDRTLVSCTAGRFFTNWAMREDGKEKKHMKRKSALITKEVLNKGFLGDVSDKESACQDRTNKRWRFHPWVKITWKRKWHPTPVLLPGESQDRGAWQDTIQQFSSVQSLSHVWLVATPWATACQASLSITDSWVYPNMSIE